MSTATPPSQLALGAFLGCEIAENTGREFEGNRSGGSGAGVSVERRYVEELNAPSEEQPRASVAPMLAHYLKIKREYPEHLLLYQVGDFYEIFFDDAKIAAEILGIRLTSRNKDDPEPVPMCGVPMHAIDNYLPRILKAGRSCILVSQVEEERGKRGAVRREITRIVTPGVRYDGDGLDDRSYNFLAAMALSPRGSGSLAWSDVSTGHLRLREVETLEELNEALEAVRPAEVILPGSLLEVPVERGAGWVREVRGALRKWGAHVVFRPFERCSRDELVRRVSEFVIENGGGGMFTTLSAESLSTVAVLLDYVAEVSFGKPPRLATFTVERENAFVLIDRTTRRNLEILETIHDGERKHSLRDAIDTTRTPMGSRLLSDWLIRPLVIREEIEKRNGAVAELVNRSEERERIRAALTGMRDLERLLSRVTTQRATPRDLRALCDSLALFPSVQDGLSTLAAPRFSELRAAFDPLGDLYERLAATLTDDPPGKLNEGGIIREGFHPELDRLRSISRDGGTWLAKFEARERERTGITGLRVRYNNVFGYSIEIPKAQAGKAPAHYERRQTLTNAERFVTAELKEFEEASLSARSRELELEKVLFVELREAVACEAPRIQRSGGVVSELDVLAAFAHAAVEHRYVRPVFVENGAMRISGSRHPVVEKIVGRHRFVPNDVELDSEDRRFAVLTGPNMGGKSTYLRQIGLTQLLAQAGSFVPADAAELCLVDRIFIRIGASDDLTRGDSTFMVEMREVSQIVQKATARSLVLIDEVGRGTATSDGLAIATAIVEWLHEEIRCRTVFATHFHELTELVPLHPGMFSIRVGVIEREREIILTHRIERGAANRSYGIEVARLAGLPEKLLTRAEEILQGIEDVRRERPWRTSAENKGSVRRARFPGEGIQPGTSSELARILRRVKSCEIDRLTPLEALNELAALKRSVAELMPGEDENGFP